MTTRPYSGIGPVAAPPSSGHRPAVPTVRRWAVVLAVALAAAAGCATVSVPLPVAARPMPPPVAAPLPVAANGPAPHCGDAAVSLRPLAPRPAPEAMPARSTMASIAKRGFLTVGVLSDVPPFGFINPLTGDFEGFDVDIANEVGLAIFGVPGRVKLRAVTNAERISVIRDGVVDLVVATMTVNCQRRTQVDFSSVYYDALQRVLVLRGSPYRGIADLAGRKVCAAAGTTTLQHIAENKAVPYPMPDVADCLVALQTGAADAMSTDDTILQGIVEQDPHTQIVGPPTAHEPAAIAVSRRHPDLTRFVNGVLEQIKRDGRWTAIYHRWFASLGPTPAPPVGRYRD